MGEKKITTMVLSVDLQCERCYNKTKRLLCKYDQIRDQVYDEKQNKVKIVVVCCNPERIRDKLLRSGGKTIKGVEIIVPDSKKPSPGGDKPAAAAADSKKPSPGGDKPAAADADPKKKPSAGDKPPAEKAASKEAPPKDKSPPKPAKGTDAAPAGAGAPKPSKDGPPAKGDDQAAPPKPKDGGQPKQVAAMPPAPDMATMMEPLTMMGAVQGYPTPSYHYQLGAYGGAPQRYGAYNYPTGYGPPPPPPAAPAFYGNTYPTYSSYGSYPTPSYPHPPYNNYNYFTEENPSTCSVM